MKQMRVLDIICLVILKISTGLPALKQASMEQPSEDLLLVKGGRLSFGVRFNCEEGC